MEKREKERIEIIMGRRERVWLKEKVKERDGGDRDNEWREREKVRDKKRKQELERTNKKERWKNNGWQRESKREKKKKGKRKKREEGIRARQNKRKWNTEREKIIKLFFNYFLK